MFLKKNVSYIEIIKVKPPEGQTHKEMENTEIIKPSLRWS